MIKWTNHSDRSVRSDVSSSEEFTGKSSAKALLREGIRIVDAAADDAVQVQIRYVDLKGGHCMDRRTFLRRSAVLGGGFAVISPFEALGLRAAHGAPPVRTTGY